MAAIDREFVKKSFNASAETYDRYAGLQRETGASLLDLAAGVPGSCARILDIGMGTGNLTEQLSTAYPGARVYGCDIAYNMLARARARLSGQPLLFSAADAEQLPYGGGAFDLVASNFTYQWVAARGAALGEVFRVLRPGGQFIFSVFGSGTLTELRQAFNDACTDAGYDGGRSFELPVTERGMQEDLREAGFLEVFSTSFTRQVTYPTVNNLVRAVKGMGARNASQYRNRSAGVRRVWLGMIERYESRYGTPAGVPATFEIIMGSGRRR